MLSTGLELGEVHVFFAGRWFIGVDGRGCARAAGGGWSGGLRGGMAGRTLAAFARSVSVRFDLIDRVVEQSAQRLTAVKNVTAAEEYLGDHFPGFPVLPGVMMLETLVQAGRRLVADQVAESDTGPLVVSDVRNVKYGNMVRPGQTLRVEVTLRKQDEGEYEFQGVGTVDEQVAVQGRFRLTPLARVDR